MPPSIPIQPQSPRLARLDEKKSPNHEVFREAAAVANSSNRREETNVAAGSQTTLNLSPAIDSFSSLYNNPNSLALSGAAFGGGMYGAAGGYNSMMFGSPYYGMMPPGPLSGLNQFLFGVQNVIFSLGQAVQILGMNTQALNQLLESATAMFDHAVATFHEMRAIEAAETEYESEEVKKRRRRLRALRWAMVTAVTYAGYKLIRRIFFSRQRHQRLIEAPPQAAGQMTPYQPYSYSNGGYAPYGYSAPYGSSPPYGGYSPGSAGGYY